MYNLESKKSVKQGFNKIAKNWLPKSGVERKLGSDC